MTRRIVILTGAELRHAYFRKAMALCDGIEVIRSYTEGFENNLRARVERIETGNDLQLAHLDSRQRSEDDFFEAFVRLSPDQSNPVAIARGSLNDEPHSSDIAALAPDLLVSYGCSIVRGPLLSTYQGRFINIHLGLSPYYRGSGTNFWPLVNGEPEFVGVTFMHIDSGIDTGEIVHQMRARIYPNDTPHQIGNRLIKDMAFVCADLVRAFDQLQTMPQPQNSATDRVYRKRDFTDQATRQLYDNFQSGLIGQYIEQREAREQRVQLVENPMIVGRPI